MQWPNKTGQWYKSQNRQLSVLFRLSIVLSVLWFISLSRFVCPLYCLFCDLYHCPVLFVHCIVRFVIYKIGQWCKSQNIWYNGQAKQDWCKSQNGQTKQDNPVSFVHCIVCAVIYIIVPFRLAIVLSVLRFTSLSCFVCPFCDLHQSCFAWL
jgi:hypothetical protein